MQVTPLVLLALSGIPLAAAVLSALVRRDHETGGTSLRAAPYVCLGLLVGSAAAAGSNLALAGTLLTFALVFAVAALSTWGMDEEWDPMFALGLFSALFAMLFVLGGSGETAAMVLSALCAAVTGAVFAPLPEHARSMQLDGGLA